MSRRGFTLLEAILALTILSSVVIVCVGMRAGAMARADRLERRDAAQRDAQAIFEMATSNLLPPPIVSEDRLTRTWRGEHLGAPYTLQASLTSVANPVAPVAPTTQLRLSDQIFVWRYTLTFEGRPDRAEFLWHR